MIRVGMLLMIRDRPMVMIRDGMRVIDGGVMIEMKLLRPATLPPWLLLPGSLLRSRQGVVGVLRPLPHARQGPGEQDQAGQGSPDQAAGKGQGREGGQAP